MAAETAQVGEVIAGYRLERVLGTGAMSCVYLGMHLRLNRKAAIKVLAAELVFDPHAVRRLLDEARMVNDIHHPRIIDIYDFVETESPKRVALVMEYIEGPSLRALLEARGLSFTQAIGLILQLCDAVRAAHRAGVIHRDLKPENLLLVREPGEGAPELKVVDFGIAKSFGASPSLTATGTMIGTPAYMAPEQIAGAPPPSPATDVYAIGELLYEVLARARAFPHPEQLETVRAKMRGEAPELALSGVPHAERLRELIVRCLAFEAERRPRLDQVVETLGELIAIEPKKTRSPAWLFAPLALLGAAGAVAAVLLTRQAPVVVVGQQPIAAAPAGAPERTVTATATGTVGEVSAPVSAPPSKSKDPAPAKKKRPPGPIGEHEFPSW